MITKAELVAMIVAIGDDGGYNEIRFGDPESERGVMDALVIRHQPTAGGMQYSIREVYMRGEGSGIYSLDAGEIADWAFRIIERYMKPHPNPMINALVAKSKPRDLSFYQRPVLAR